MPFSSRSILNSADNPDNVRGKNVSLKPPVLGIDGAAFTKVNRCSSSGKVRVNFFVQDAIPPFPVKGNNPIIFILFTIIYL